MNPFLKQPLTDSGEQLSFINEVYSAFCQYRTSGDLGDIIALSSAWFGIFRDMSTVSEEEIISFAQNHFHPFFSSVVSPEGLNKMHILRLGLSEDRKKILTLQVGIATHLQAAMSLGFVHTTVFWHKKDASDYLGLIDLYSDTDRFGMQTQKPELPIINWPAICLNITYDTTVTLEDLPETLLFPQKYLSEGIIISCKEENEEKKQLQVDERKVGFFDKILLRRES